MSNSNGSYRTTPKLNTPGSDQTLDNSARPDPQRRSPAAANGRARLEDGGALDGASKTEVYHNSTEEQNGMALTR